MLCKLEASIKGRTIRKVMGGGGGWGKSKNKNRAGKTNKQKKFVHQKCLKKKIRAETFQ
jgi:hypothetical protein